MIHIVSGSIFESYSIVDQPNAGPDSRKTMITTVDNHSKILFFKQTEAFRGRQEAIFW